jgi:hypothetical protein
MLKVKKTKKSIADLATDDCWGPLVLPDLEGFDFEYSESRRAENVRKK